MTTIFKKAPIYHEITAREFGSFPCHADNTIKDNSLFKTLDTDLKNTFAKRKVLSSQNREPFPDTLYSSTTCGEPFSPFSRTFPVFDKECSTIRTTIAVTGKTFAAVSETPGICCNTFATISGNVGTSCESVATTSGTVGTCCQISATSSETLGTCYETSAVVKKTSPAIREPIIEVSRPVSFPVLPVLPVFKTWQVEKSGKSKNAHQLCTFIFIIHINLT